MTLIQNAIANQASTAAPLRLIPQLMPVKDTVLSGLSGAIGCDFIPATNQLAFVEYSGNVSIYNLLRPLVGIVSSGTATLQGTYIFDLETGTQGGGLSGPGDIWWEQQTAVLRQMLPVAGAKLYNLGAVDFASLDSAGLQTLTYTTSGISGNDDASNKLTDGDVFAVFTNAGNYAKVQVLHYGYNIQIHWVTYKIGQAYRALGSGYSNPESIVVQKDGRHAYVSERSGNILHIDLQSAARASATVICSGLTAPQQIALNIAQDVIYCVEYAANGRLLAINVTTKMVNVLATGLENAVGCALSLDESLVYISEQSSGSGRVRTFNLKTNAFAEVCSGLTAPFFMRFLDPGCESLCVVERDPANRVAIINLANGNTITRPSVALGFRPSALAVIKSGQALVTCDTEIDAINFGLSAITGPLFKGIGFVPFDRIVNGLADTSGDPGYFFQVKNVPFGGVLPMKVNHGAAWIQGARYYSILIDGQPRNDSWTDYLWDTTQNRYILQTISPSTVAGSIVYPVRDLASELLWFTEDLGARIDTTNYTDAMHTLQLNFYNGVGGLLSSTSPLQIRLENSPCSATLAIPHIGGVFAGADCGVLKYPASNSLVTLQWTAAQAHNFATYSLTVERGVNALTPPSQSGPVTGATITINPTAAQLLGSCTLAGFAEYLYVAATAIDGESRLSQYDAQRSLAFVLSP